MAVGQDPGQRRRQVWVALRALRQGRGLSQQDVADELEWSLSKVVRIENGRVAVSKTDLRALLALYDVTDEAEVADLVEAARIGRGKPWWQDYHDLVRPLYAQYLAFEQAASALYAYNPAVVPGFVQTEEYADAVRLRSVPDVAQRRRLVELLARRQEFLLGANGPQVTIVVDECALRRVVGGYRVMVEQLERLLDLSEGAHVSIRVLSALSDAQATLGGPVVVLDIPDEGGVVYLEGMYSDNLIRREDAAYAKFSSDFQDLADATMKHKEGQARIEELCAEYRRALK